MVHHGSPDLVHISGGPGGLQLLRKLPVPVVYTSYHTFTLSHSRYHPQYAYGLVEAASYRTARAVVAISPSTAASVRRMGMSPDRVRVVSPGVDLAAYEKESAARVSGRVAFVGRLFPEKGPLDAVAAMKMMAESCPRVSGVVLGSGPLEARVREACEEIPNGRVAFLGAVPDEEVVRTLLAAEVVLMPSRFEGLGLVALEAMAASSVVVAYDVVGLADTVGGRGVVVPAGDIGAMAAAALDLLQHEELRSRLAMDGRRAVQEERSWAFCAAEMERIYEEVLAGW